MKESYRKDEWMEFRKTCIERVGHCEICERSHGVTLQVHHPHYISGCEPWEYPVDFCQVICSGCHAREHGIIPPSHGWELASSDWEDGTPSGPKDCELCGTSMEWWNHLWHPDWGIIIVGSDCAERLGNPDVHKLRRRVLRMRAFINSPRWKRVYEGFQYKHGKTQVFAVATGGRFRLYINGKRGVLTYASLVEAKERAALVIHSKPIQ